MTEKAGYYDDDTLSAIPYSYVTYTTEIVAETFDTYVLQLIRDTVTSDDDGTIRIKMTKSQKSVRLTKQPQTVQPLRLSTPTAS